jgi:lipopolysaccharide heptosyltransferase II
MGYNKILFFKPGAIGDLLHTLPSLKALRRAFPDAAISIVVSPGLDQLLEGTGIADHILVFDKVSVKKSIRGFAAFISQLHREQYDLFVDMQPSSRSRIVRWLSGSRHSLVYQKQKSVKAGRQRLHAVENFMATLAPIRVRGPVDRIELPVRPEAARAVDAFLASREISTGTALIALNCSVGAARPSRNWFPDRFSQLADRIIRECGSTVIFIGGKEDRELVDGVLAGMQEKGFSAAGDLNLAETAALLARCRSLVSSDTGPLHLATAVQTPVVGLFGSTDPRRTGPVGDIHRVVRKKLPCVPCEKKICPLSTQACMSAITADDILSALKDSMRCS